MSVPCTEEILSSCLYASLPPPLCMEMVVPWSFTGLFPFEECQRGMACVVLPTPPPPLASCPFCAPEACIRSGLRVIPRKGGNSDSGGFGLSRDHLPCPDSPFFLP